MIFRPETHSWYRDGHGRCSLKICDVDACLLKSCTRFPHPTPGLEVQTGTNGK